MKTLSVVLLAALAGCSSNVVKIDATDNLAPQHEIECIPYDQVINSHTPADLMSGVRACIENKQFETTAGLLAITGAYGHYDKQRVADKTAHQAIQFMLTRDIIQLPEKDNIQVQRATQDLYANPVKLAELCRFVTKLGAPDYYPQYMIAHGMGAVIDKETHVLIQNFNHDIAWQSSLRYIRCDESA